MRVLHVSQCPVQCVHQPRPISPKPGKNQKKKPKKAKRNKTHLSESLRVGYVQAPHPVLMPELFKVPLVRAPAPVRVVTANLARELQVQAVQFVQPIRNGFPVPAHWQLERVVNLLVLVVVLLFHPIVILLSLGFELREGQRRLLLYVPFRSFQLLPQMFQKLLDQTLQPGHAFSAILLLLGVLPAPVADHGALREELLIDLR